MAETTSIAINDFNGDGMADPAGLMGCSAFVTLFNLSDATFASPVRSTPYFNPNVWLSGLAVGDLNHDDGKSDIIAAYTATRVFLNDGTGTFNTSYVYDPPGDGVSALCSADFNADGRNDLAMMNRGLQVTLNTPCN